MATKLFSRHPENPIVQPGIYPWRRAVTFNPAVLHENGRFFMFERTAGSLTPFQCRIGLLESTDGVHFSHTVEEPVITPSMLGSEHGSVQDPRIVKIGPDYLMTVAFRPYAWNSYPTGVGVPHSAQADYPGFDGNDSRNQTRSAILRSGDMRNWDFVSWVNDMSIDDRNVILFPERINGRYAVLRRPQCHVGTQTEHDSVPSIQLSYSDDLLSWSPAKKLLQPLFDWEDNRIGGSTPPIRTSSGWLLFYHGVQNLDTKHRAVVYRMGAALLDPDNPEKVIARSSVPLLQPETYYERVGLYIPNVVFPTAAILLDGTIWLYYGVCDTAIALAQAPLDAILEALSAC